MPEHIIKLAKILHVYGQLSNFSEICEKNEVMLSCSYQTHDCPSLALGFSSEL